MFASSSRVRTRRVVSFVGGDCFAHFVELKSQSITRLSCACHARQFGQNISSIYIDCMENSPAILFRRAQLLTPRLGVYYGGRMFTRRECERAKIPRIRTRSSRVCKSVAFASVCSRRIERPDNWNEVCGHRGSRIPGRMLRKGAEERRLRWVLDDIILGMFKHDSADRWFVEIGAVISSKLTRIKLIWMEY